MQNGNWNDGVVERYRKELMVDSRNAERDSSANLANPESLREKFGEWSAWSEQPLSGLRILFWHGDPGKLQKFKPLIYANCR